LRAKSLIVLALGVFGGGNSTTHTQQPPDRCVGLGSLQVDGLRWNAAGDGVFAGLYDYDGGDGVVASIAYPSGEVHEIRRSARVMSYALAVMAGGPIWIENTGVAFELWTQGASSARRLGILPGLPASLRAAGDQLFGLDTTSHPAIVRIKLEAAIEYEPVVTSTHLVESFDVDPAGTLVYGVSDGPGTPLAFEMRTATATVHARPPGRLIGNPIFGPEPGLIYYEDHDQGAVLAIDPSTGETRVILRVDASESVFSASGVLAHTGVLPARVQEVCFASPSSGPAVPVAT